MKASTRTKRRQRLIRCSSVLASSLAFSCLPFCGASFVTPSDRQIFETSSSSQKRPSTRPQSFPQQYTPSKLNLSKRSTKADGVYVRPSAAIERGSGFFVPGLEGPRVRLLVGCLGLVLAGWNHVAWLTLSQQNEGNLISTPGTTFAESIAVVYSLFVLLQGSIEYFKETRVDSFSTVGSNRRKDTSDAASAASKWTQVWSVPVDNEKWRGAIEWAARSYLALTPTSQMLVLGSEAVIFRLEKEDTAYLTDGSESKNDDNNIQAACRQAMDLLAQSSTGRISLPTVHPVSTVLASLSSRTVVLQRINESTCLLIASNDLLAAYRKQDLAWLGQLAKYLDSTSR